MQTKINLLIIGAILIVAGFISLFFIEPGDKSPAVPVTGTIPSTSTDTPLSVSALSEEAVESGSAEKEFTMTAYYDATGKWFSLKEIAVKKGDTVRVKITNIKGMHDFTIDEFGVAEELPLDEEVVVEFVADRVGDFIYYCSKPGHRAGGQWGTIRVTE